MTADHVDQRRPRAAKRDVQDVDAGLDLEQLAGQMQEGADTGRCVLQFAGLALGQRDELLDAVDRQAGIDRDDIRRGYQHGDRGEGFQRIVRQRVEPRIDRAGERYDQQRMAILWRVGNDFAADHAAGAAAIVDDDLLAKPLAEMLGDDAGDDVVDAAGRERHHKAHRLIRVVLRQGRDSKPNNTTAAAVSTLRMPAMNPPRTAQACAAGAIISTLRHGDKAKCRADAGRRPVRRW